jgi:hypothetical protein
MIGCRILLFILVVLLGSSSARSQTTDSQFWAEYMLNHPFGDSWNVELAATYSTLLKTSGWQSFDLQVTPEYILSSHLDLQGSLLYSHTLQYQPLTSTEFRAMLGTRIHLTPKRRVLTRILLRLEQRYLYYPDVDTREQSARGRLRLETVVPLNKKSMFGGDNLWYVIGDAEAFVPLDDQLDERFLSRYRFRFGPGFRLNYTWRFEFLYNLQQSRNTLVGDFNTTDNIFRVRVKHFLHQDRSSRLQGNGN